MGSWAYILDDHFVNKLMKSLFFYIVVILTLLHRWNKKYKQNKITKIKATLILNKLNIISPVTVKRI